jgi:membrane-bound lytic murein transglycosylase D
MDDPLVRKWENYYASRPQFMQRVLERSRPYLYHVADEVEKRGMPMELALLPFIESAYNPQAVSHAQAAGMWQFIPGTGQRFGLERTWWYDGRRDVVAATSAALNYLGQLYGMFGDWPLALASYNWGENAVARAVKKTQKASGEPDPGYLDIKMPDETRNYVPKLMAVRNIISNPAAFGVALLALPNKPYFSAITPGKHMDVKVAAELAEIPVAELLRLNPGFVRPVIAHKEDRQLILPANKIETFQRNLASYDKPLLNWQAKATRAGEPYSEIAKRSGLSLAQLKDINDIPAREARARGQTILIPKSLDVVNREQDTLDALAAKRKEVSTPVQSPRVATTASSYRVKAGDTLFSIARNSTMTVDEIKRVNGLKSNQLVVGTLLRLPPPNTPAAAPTRRDYLVKKGDTLGGIANRFGTSVTELKRRNKIGATLRPGMRLTIQ